jgi:hypothetical protein
MHWSDAIITASLQPESCTCWLHHNLVGSNSSSSSSRGSSLCQSWNPQKNTGSATCFPPPRDALPVLCSLLEDVSGLHTPIDPCHTWCTGLAPQVLEHRIRYPLMCAGHTALAVCWILLGTPTLQPVVTHVSYSHFHVVLRCMLCSLPEAELGLPDLVGGESYEWAAIDNLDAFFTRIYRWVTRAAGCCAAHDQLGEACGVLAVHLLVGACSTC